MSTPSATTAASETLSNDVRFGQWLEALCPRGMDAEEVASVYRAAEETSFRYGGA